MDTSPHALAALLTMCRHNNVLGTEATIVAPEWAKHGDVCITSLPRAPLLQSTVPLMTTEGERRDGYECVTECPSIDWGRVVRAKWLHARKIEAWKKFGCFALRQLKRKRLFGHLGQFLQTIKARGRIQQMAGHMQKMD